MEKKQEGEYKYKAFISYSSKDSKVVKKLSRKLTDYTLPKPICKKYGVEKKLGEIFFYENGLSGNEIKKTLRRKLTESEYLIVVCSPDAAVSDWVNQDEIGIFIEQGRTNKIIPFIIKGKPGASDPKEECYPPKLRGIKSADGKLLLRGPNIQINGFRHALVELIATIIGADFEELLDYDKIRERRKKIICFIAAIFALLVGFFCWDYFRAVNEYYADYVDCWGVPKGIIAVDKEQRKHRSGTYRFEYRRIPLGQPDAFSWRLDRVCYINSAGNPTEVTNFVVDEGRCPIQEYVYSDENGALTQIIYRSNTGKILSRHKISRHNDVAASIADVESCVEGGGIGYALTTSFTRIKEDELGEKRSKITRYAYTRDKNGYILTTTYHANNDNDLDASVIADYNGVFGIAYERDSLGRKSAMKYLNKDKSLSHNEIGLASSTYKYDSRGQVCEIRNYDISGELMSKRLCASTIKETDIWGNIIKENFYNNVNNPFLLDIGSTAFINKFDSQGNLIEQVYFGIDGKPCLRNEGFAKITQKHDDRGNIIEEAYFGIDGKLCLNKDGIAKITQKYDDRGNIIEQAFFGIDGKPCFNNYGGAKYTQKYDDRGNIIEKAYFGIDGKPCLRNEGFAKITQKHDDRGNIIEQEYFGIDGKPCLCNEGFAKITYKCDDRGNIIEEAYFGIDGKPCLCDKGYAKGIQKCDDRGNIIEQSYFGIDGKPCFHNYGGAKYTQKYDDRGNRIEETYFGIDGELCLNNEGIAKATYKYDYWGLLIEKAYFGIDGEPCLHKEGYAKWFAKCEDRGNIIEQAYFGIDGKPCLCNEGFAKAIQKCDDRGNIIEEAYFGIDGKPCLHKEGFAKRVGKYDNRGNRIEEACFGIDGKPCLSDDGYAKLINKYDARGNGIEQAYFDIDGKPCLSNDGIAKLISKYDARGNAIEQSYYGIDGKPCLCKDGYARMQIINGNYVFYDTTGKIIF